MSAFLMQSYSGRANDIDFLYLTINHSPNYTEDCQILCVEFAGAVHLSERNESIFTRINYCETSLLMLSLYHEVKKKKKKEIKNQK